MVRSEEEEMLDFLVEVIIVQTGISMPHRMNGVIEIITEHITEEAHMIKGDMNPEEEGEVIMVEELLDLEILAVAVGVDLDTYQVRFSLIFNYWQAMNQCQVHLVKPRLDNLVMGMQELPYLHIHRSPLQI